MKVVVDTNVVVSGSLTAKGPSAEIIDLILKQSLTLLFDDRILEEYREVLARPKFHLEKIEIDKLLEAFLRLGWRVNAHPLSILIPDPDDLPFLEVAFSGHADCLITGNKKDFGKLPHLVRILSPSEFLIDFKFDADGPRD